jgi:hypothetical protein
MYMIITPTLSRRILWGGAGFTIVGASCVIGVIAFPVGILVACVALPMAFFMLAYAFGMSTIRVDDEGVAERNFFLVTRLMKWSEIERGEMHPNFRLDPAITGWTNRRSKLMLSFSNKTSQITIDSKFNTSTDKDWWKHLEGIARKNLGDRFIVR